MNLYLDRPVVGLRARQLCEVCTQTTQQVKADRDSPILSMTQPWWQMWINVMLRHLCQRYGLVWQQYFCTRVRGMRYYRDRTSKRKMGTQVNGCTGEAPWKGNSTESDWTTTSLGDMMRDLLSFQIWNWTFAASSLSADHDHCNKSCFPYRKVEARMRPSSNATHDAVLSWYDMLINDLDRLQRRFTIIKELLQLCRMLNTSCSSP